MKKLTTILLILFSFTSVYALDVKTASFETSLPSGGVYLINSSFGLDEIVATFKPGLDIGREYTFLFDASNLFTIDAGEGNSIVGFQSDGSGDSRTIYRDKRYGAITLIKTTETTWQCKSKQGEWFAPE